MPLPLASNHYFNCNLFLVYKQTVPNPNPTYKMKPVYEEPMAEKPLSVRVTAVVDAYVRSQPSMTQWLREAIAEKYERDQSQA